MVIGGVLSEKLDSLQSFIPTDTTESSSNIYGEVEDIDGDVNSFQSQSKKRLLAIQDRRNSEQAENLSNKVVIALPEASESVASIKVHSSPERIRCLCCRSTKIVSVSGTTAKRRLRLRELLWCSLGLDKYYDRPEHPFPFCKKCEKRLEHMEEICESIKKFQEKFEKCRKDLSRGVLEQLLTMGKVAKKVGAYDVGESKKLH